MARLYYYHILILQVMSYSIFIFEQANTPKDIIPYVIVGQGAINVLATVFAVSFVFQSWIKKN